MNDRLISNFETNRISKEEFASRSCLVFGEARRYHLSSTASGGDSCRQATALLARLQSDPTKSSVVLFASYESGLLRIRQSHRGATPQNIDPESLTDESDSAESFANKVRDALSITGSGMILLALAWTGESSQRLFQMYPEFKSGDSTYKTNSEKRELHMMFQQQTGVGKPFSNAVVQLCNWHKLNRNLTKSSKFKSIIAQLTETDDVIEWEMIVSWLWKFARYQTREEADLSQQMLMHYLDEDEDLHRGRLGGELIEKLKVFLVESFFLKKDLFFSYHLQTKAHFGQITSTISEVENAAMKGDSMGPKPYHDIDLSQQSIEKREARRNREKEMAAAHEENENM
ncbi:expressed unknown protein [Seminavis robusta]|uniref:Uncharacterized protein n=1 Tax=Seminavis robusta TaxID=568900 RepID=A0A9N8HZF5_9STRA|nr:expressed unknown protein [Seminavis robusta]|eukprot:Sro3530_g348952.1  (344) ;mRNA; f:5084-6115